MEKVTLTKDQERELVAFQMLGHSLEDWINNKNNPNESHCVLYELSVDKMARLLYSDIEYEVEPEFEVGDKVVHKDLEYGEGQAILTLLSRKMPMSEEAWNHGFIEWDYSRDIRYATEEEIYWLETLGRKKVGDFTEGDIVVTDLNVPITCGEYDVPGRLIGPERLQKFYKNNSLKGIYPAESFKPFSQ